MLSLLSILEESRTMKKSVKVSYDADAGVLSLMQSSRASIDYAKEAGNMVIHFTRSGVPVLVEILEASHVVKQNQGPFKKVSSIFAHT